MKLIVSGSCSETVNGALLDILIVFRSNLVALIEVLEEVELTRLIKP